MQFRVKLLSSTALAAVAALAASSVSAQDIGALEKRVQALEKSGGGEYVARSKKTMNLVLSGRSAHMVRLKDNGQTSAIIISGNAETETMINLAGTGKVSDDIDVKTTIEFGETSSVTQLIDSNNLTDDQGTFNIRQLNIKLTSKTYGAFTIGDGSLATDGYNGKGDMSGTRLVQTDGGAMIGAEPFKNSTTGANSGITGAIFANHDAGRTDNVRYDSPRFAGFQAQASFANEDDHNVGLNYGADFGGVKVQGAIAYDVRHNGGGLAAGNADANTINGSIGMLLPMGLSAAVAFSDVDADAVNADRDKIYVKVGYMFTGSELGTTMIAVDWSRNQIDNLTNDEGERFSLGVVQNVEPLGAEVYAAYHNFAADRTNISIDDITVITAGLRFRF